MRLPGRALPGTGAAPKILDLEVGAAAEGGVAARIEPGESEAAEVACWGPDAARGFLLRRSCELVLPRAWSAAMEPLELDPAEQQVWQVLRRRLAESQGVVVGDEIETCTVLHRLGGYPD